MRQILAIAFFTVCTATLWASDGSEKGVPTSPLTTYSAGLGIGAAKVLTSPLDSSQSQFLTLSFVNNVYLRDNLNLFFDIDWFGTGVNFGANIGFDYLVNVGDFRPFIGAGFGGNYFDKISGNFGDRFGPSGTIHLGLLFDVSDQLQIRFRVPYRFVADRNNDQIVGFDIGFMFSDKYRKVKKLNYN